MVYSRLGKDEYFLQIASLVSQRSTCPRRQVGCVLVDSQNYIVATGYNGVPSGFRHCTEIPCKGAQRPSGEGLDLCEAIHAETNAFLQLKSNEDLTAYVTVTPCVMCAKMIANSRVKRLVALELYKHTQALEMLKKANIQVEIYDSNK